MDSRILKYLLLIIITTAAFWSCMHDEEYPIIPEIKFKDFVLLVNPSSGIIERGVLKITFKDGDGDIGLKQSDTVAPYDYNLFITYYEIRNKDTIEVFLIDPINGDTSTFNARIPILTPGGSGKSISGEIEDTLWIYDPTSIYDTIMFEAYLMDRALHESNKIITPLIIRQ